MLFSISGMNSDIENVLDKLGGFNETLVTLIHSWDVYEDADQLVMVPIDAERFKSLSISFKKDVFLAIVEDIKGPN
jgi:hypothetical protein